MLSNLIGLANHQVWRSFVPMNAARSEWICVILLLIRTDYKYIVLFSYLVFLNVEPEQNLLILSSESLLKTCPFQILKIIYNLIEVNWNASNPLLTSPFDLVLYGQRILRIYGLS